MFDWLQKLNPFGGGKTSSTSDPAAQQRKKEEEERRKREAEAKRAQEAAARQRQQQAANKRTGIDSLTTPANRSLQKAQPAQKLTAPEQEISKLYGDNIEKARKETRKGMGFFETVADTLAGGAAEKRAEVLARDRAASQYQEKNGFGGNDIQSFNNRTLQKAKANTDAVQKSIDNTKTAVDVIRYLPGAGIGELGANTLRGNFSGSKESDDTLLREQMELTPAQIAALPQGERDKMLAISKGGLGAGVLDFVGVGAGAVAKNLVKGGAKSTAKTSVKQLTKDIASKQGAKMIAKNAGVGAVAGAGIGAGGTAILGGDEEDIAQAAVRGGVGGAFGGVASSPLDIAASTLTKGKAARTAVQNITADAEAASNIDAGLKNAARVAASEENAVIPGATPISPEEAANQIEIAPGIKIEPEDESTRGAFREEGDNRPAFEIARERNEAQALIDADVNAIGQDITDIPAYQRQGRVLQSERTDMARADEIRTQLGGMPNPEQIRANEFELRQKFARDVQARPDLRFQLQMKLNDNLSQLKASLDEAGTLQNELGILDTKLGSSQQQRKLAQALEEENAIQSEVNIPDVSNPIALAKGEELDAMPMANFREAENGNEALAPVTVEQTPVDIAEEVAQGDLGALNTEVDAQGNQALQTDAEAAQQLAEAGLTPNQAESPLEAQALQEEAARAEDVAQQVDGQTNAPLTREAAISRVTDEEVRSDLMQNAPRKERVNLEDADNAAKAYLNSMDDAQVVSNFETGIRVDDPTSFYTALNAVRRLERINTPEAQAGLRQAVDAMADYAAESGRGLRTVQVLFDDMPATMKVDYLERKLSKAGADLNDADRAQLAGFIQKADDATTNLRTLEDKARALLEDGTLRNGEITPELQAQIRSLSESIDEATINKEAVSGEAFRDYQRHLDGEVPLGKKAGDIGRTLMLSAPSGRIFDVISTTATATDDMLNRGVSNLIGKGVNAIAGAGKVQDTLANPRQLTKGLKEGVQRIGRQFKGDDFVEDFLGEAKRSTRGDINTGGGVVRRTVRTLVETPTNLTRGLRKDQLYREGMQEAAKQGLKGDAQKAYAEVRALVPTSTQLDSAIDAQMRANMLHENGVSRALNGLARSLDSNKALGGWLAPLVRNQIAPFTSWLGGNLHRTFTDKNVLFNAGSAINNARKGNLQGVIDDVSKFGVNSAQAYAVGALLTQAGLITNEDANGDDYAGLYIHVGDRYIPAAILGTASVPLILGNAFEQASQAAQEDGSGASAFINALTVNVLKNAGVASVFGGENNLQSTVSGLAKGQIDVADTGVKFVGDVVRQYLPSLTGDINAFLDMSGLNPTGEKANTKVLTSDPDDNASKQDVLSTELSKTINRIPFASQTLERDEGKAAQDPLDRILKGNRETGEMKTNRENAKSLTDTKKALEKEGVPTTADDIKAYAESGEYDLAIRGAEYRLKELEAKEGTPESTKKKIREQITEFGLERDGVPTTKEGIKAVTENGDWDNGIKGLEYQLSKIEGNKNKPESERKTLRDNIKRLELTRDNGFDATAYALYESMGVENWRALGDPEGDDYNAELYNTLDSIDQLFTENSVSRASKGTGKRKYTEKTSGSRGGSGKKSVSTDIGTNKISFNPTDLKKVDAKFGTPQSAIPVLQKVQNFDQSKLKKIKVTKGV